MTTPTTYANKGNAIRAARNAAIAAGVAAPLAGVHFQVTEPSEAPGQFAFYLLDVKTGETAKPEPIDAGAAFDDVPPGRTTAELLGKAMENDPEFQAEVAAILNPAEDLPGAPTVEEAARQADAIANAEFDIQEVDVATLPAPPAIKGGAPRQHKNAAVLKMLASKKGATIAQIQAVTGWLPHTTRAFISVTPKKAGLVVTSEKTEAGRVYRTAPAA